MELKGSKTEKNLMKAFAGESEARNKYTYYASAAKKEGYEQIAAYFAETAENEKEHAKMWFKLIHGIHTTKENLADAAEGERYEWTSMYKRFAKQARAEGFDKIAEMFEGVAKVERDHQKRYNALLKNLEEGKVFKRDREIVWVCRNCGYRVKALEAPIVCPVCSHPQAYFEMESKNY